MTDSNTWVSVARLIRPQGRKGELLADILTDFPERFTQIPKAFLSRMKGDPSPVLIEQAWLHKGRVVLKFAGVDSISAAEALRGAELVIPAVERVALDSEMTYIDDLIGCELVDRSQTEHHPVIGTVRDVIRQENTADLLVVAGADGVEHWIPFAKAYLVEMDLPGRRLEMNLPAGLLEVNAPPSEEELHAQQSEAADSGE